MKRQIVEILYSMRGGIKHDVKKTPHWTLFYNIVEDGKIITKKKPIDGICTEIEDVWDEVETRPSYTNPHTLLVAICKETHKLDSNYTKQWCFVSVLQRILVDGLKPKGNVSIWQEEKGDIIRTYAQCEVWKNY